MCEPNAPRVQGTRSKDFHCLRESLIFDNPPNGPTHPHATHDIVGVSGDVGVKFAS